MGEQLSTVIIEPRRLVREALVSLLVNHSYHVACSVASTGDIDSSVVEDAPKLVILGALPAEDAVTDASNVRRLWPETKIILLFEHASAADFNKLLTSEIDGCIPLFVSRNTLIGTLQLIIVEDLRILVVGVSNHPLTPRATRCEEKPNGFEASANKLHSGTVDYAAAPTSAIGLGCMGLSQGYGPADDDESIRTIHRALDSGVNATLTVIVVAALVLGILGAFQVNLVE